MTEYTRLTAKMTPVWKSAVRIDVSKELRAAFARAATPQLDQAARPDAEPAAPTLSPDPASPPYAPPGKAPTPLPSKGLAALVAAVILALGAWVAGGWEWLTNLFGFFFGF